MIRVSGRKRKEVPLYEPNEPPRGLWQLGSGGGSSIDWDIRREFPLWDDKLQGLWGTFKPQHENRGFIPASLERADIPHDVILRHGVNGIHYAEGWDGLKDMIAEHGEDYSPSLVITGIEYHSDGRWWGEIEDDVPSPADEAQQNQTGVPRVYEEGNLDQDNALAQEAESHEEAGLEGGNEGESTGSIAQVATVPATVTINVEERFQRMFDRVRDIEEAFGVAAKPNNEGEKIDARRRIEELEMFVFNHITTNASLEDRLKALEYF